MLFVSFGLAPGLSEFLCSSLSQCCSRVARGFQPNLAASMDSASLVWAAFGRWLRHDMLVVSFGLAPDLSEFLCSSLLPCCFRGARGFQPNLAASINSASLVWAPFGRRLRHNMLSVSPGLAPGLSEFPCSSLWPFCSKGLPTHLPTLTMSINFPELVRATLGTLLELLQDVLLSQSIWVALKPL